MEMESREGDLSKLTQEFELDSAVISNSGLLSAV